MAMVPFGNVNMGTGDANARYGIGDGAQDGAGNAMIGGMQVPTSATGGDMPRIEDGENTEGRGAGALQSGAKWSGGAEKLTIQQAGMMAMTSGIPGTLGGALASSWPDDGLRWDMNGGCEERFGLNFTSVASQRATATVTDESLQVYYMLTSTAQRMGLVKGGKKFSKEMLDSLEQLVGQGVWMFGLVPQPNGADSLDGILLERAVRMERLMRNLLPPEEIFEDLLKAETKVAMADFYLHLKKITAVQAVKANEYLDRVKSYCADERGLSGFVLLLWRMCQEAMQDMQLLEDTRSCWYAGALTDAIAGGGQFILLPDNQLVFTGTADMKSTGMRMVLDEERPGDDMDDENEAAENAFCRLTTADEIVTVLRRVLKDAVGDDGEAGKRASYVLFDKDVVGDVTLSEGRTRARTSSASSARSSGSGASCSSRRGWARSTPAWRRSRRRMRAPACPTRKRASGPS